MKLRQRRFAEKRGRNFKTNAVKISSKILLKLNFLIIIFFIKADCESKEKSNVQNL